MNKNQKNYLENYNTRLNILKKRNNSSLERFEEVYPYFKVYKDSNKYQIKMESVKTEINSVNSDIFLMENEIDKKILNINEMIQRLNKQLKNEKKKNAILKKKKDNLEEGVLTSDQLFEDSLQTYQTNVLDIFLYLFAYLFICKNIYTLIKK